MSFRFDNVPARWWTGLKLAGAGISVVAIAFGVAIFGVSAPVSKSHADLTWLDGDVEQTSTEQFEETLQQLGHESPRRYDLNGNTVFFSRNTSRHRPRRVMRKYQRAFEHQGLNDRVYRRIDPDEKTERTETALTGGLVPLALTENHVALGGAVTANRAGDADELADNLEGADDPADLFRGYRYVEISRQPDTRHTSVIASWSDEAFDFARMFVDGEATGRRHDDIVPACPGCVRLSRFADANPGHADRVELTFAGPRGIAETRRYYARVLPERGWRRDADNTPPTAFDEWFETSLPVARTETWVKEGTELTLTFTPDPETGRTLTIASRNTS